jgi:hypothetical protein
MLGQPGCALSRIFVSIAAGAEAPGNWPQRNCRAEFRMEMVDKQRLAPRRNWSHVRAGAELHTRHCAHTARVAEEWRIGLGYWTFANTFESVKIVRLSFSRTD